jgi:ubiquitin-protein ligase
MNDNNESVVITRETVKRLISDIRDLRKSPLDNEGIYYKHDESNMLLGYAYICGPPDSTYFGGNYFYKFEFPYDFPHRPPKVTFMNSDGRTRFHPNMYKSGKMCLSILNTWQGDQWTGCQSIRSILLTIVSILDDKPLLHEPGMTLHSQDFQNYNKIIQHVNFDFSINKILANKITSIKFYTESFKDEIISQFHKNEDELTNYINKLNYAVNTKIIRTRIYNLNESINWKLVYTDFNKIKLKYKIDTGN